MIARGSFGVIAMRRRTMTEQPLQGDGFIWEVRQEAGRVIRVVQRGRPRKSVCP